MNTPKHATATLSALIRTAEWSVDGAREHHRAAVQEHAARKSEHDAAKTSAEQAEQFTRELMGRSGFSPQMLIVATMNQASMNAHVERTVQMLNESDQRLNQAHRQLVQARTTLQLYERIRERRATLDGQEAARRAQREQDDAGVMLKSYESSIAVKFVEQGVTNGG